jgi:Mg-chelatase subunit ChlD
MRKATIGIVLLSALCACSANDDGSRSGASSAGSQHASTSTTNGAAGTGTASGAFSNPTLGNTPSNTGTPGANPGSQSDQCDVVHLHTAPSTPDMLIVLDRSGSMGEEGRWQPSVAAVQSIVTQLQSQIRFGLALFPDPSLGNNNNGGSVNVDISKCLNDPDPITCTTNLLADAGLDINDPGAGCAPGKIVVPVGLDNGAAIDMALMMTQPNGGTPTPDTLSMLVDQFTAPPVDPDVVPPAKFILLVTDGQPTCPAGLGSQTTQADIDASNAAVEALTAHGARTYVIGYNTTGPGNEMLAQVLDGFAMRGGTGDTHHRPVEDQASLSAEFQRIAGALVSCTFSLDKAPPRADYVLVRVDGNQINLDDPNGWGLVGDRTIELRGAACSTVQANGDHLVDAEVHCEAVVPE